MNNGSRALIGFTAAALLAMAAMPAAAATADSSAASTAVAAPQPWGPYHSPGGRRAKAAGTVTATGEDHEVIPSAAALTVSGIVTDLARTRSRCGWVVFGIATVNAAGNRVAWKRHHVRTCAYRTPKRFSFTYHRVFQVELKVCSERRGSEPSIQCTAGNPAWKNIYTSPH
ncbi:hypothetical protein E1292_21555 [Nonomuraea deserti]|uniref:Secreted protein n=1 Tax=Nonomuraea deserti TaxID=1848322 RepID=A0A4R4VDC0_9ACTN|nr:hypothetical protein [Nonomuraea deserti]TDD03282.1 hypothetical protein E1292_21555 [Nonomuraea deserti]